MLSGSLKFPSMPLLMLPALLGLAYPSSSLAVSSVFKKQLSHVTSLMIFSAALSITLHPTLSQRRLLSTPMILHDVPVVWQSFICWSDSN